MTPDTPSSGDSITTEPDTDAATPSYVRPLSRGVSPSADPLRLDMDAARQLAERVKEIENARAAAAVSGRDYLIK